jgi:tol-pal system protein YbgF
VIAAALMVASLAGAPASPAPADPAVEQGVRQLQDGDLDGAVATLDAAVRRLSGRPGAAPHLARAHVHLGVAYALLDQDKAARASFREALKAQPDLSIDRAAVAPRAARLFDEVRGEGSAKGPAAPAVDLSEYEKMQATADQSAAVDKAWKAVQAYANTASVPAADRVVALRKFQTDFPGPHAHVKDAEQLMVVLAREMSGPAPDTQAASASARELYSAAYTDYARGNYQQAIDGYRDYIVRYPQTEFTDNAQYWIGECLYSMGRYEEALNAWIELGRMHPSSDKLPDAGLKKGMALERLGRRSAALTEYRSVIERYPNTQAARVAREKLGSF